MFRTMSYEYFLISRSISSDLKGPKESINCTMDDVWGYFLGPPHDTTPARVTSSATINNDAAYQRQFEEKIKFPFKRKVCQVYEVDTVYRATNYHFVLFLRVKHHSEKLVLLELTNYILPEQA